MALPSFEDQHAAYTAAGYAVTNEEPELFRELLGRHVRPRRAAGIVSGGEVLLSVLLPRCQEVIGIDHSYRALAATWAKILLLNKYGPKKTRDLMTGEYKPFCKAVAEMADQFPEKMRTYATITGSKTAITGISVYDFDSSLRKEWRLISDDILQRAIRKLHKLTLVHGDLTDLKHYGQFDLLYVSNAFEHTNREQKYTKPMDIYSCLKPNGFLLVAGGLNSGETCLLKYKEQRGFRTTWEHRIYRKPKDAQETSDVSAISA